MVIATRKSFTSKRKGSNKMTKDSPAGEEKVVCGPCQHTSQQDRLYDRLHRQHPDHIMPPPFHTSKITIICYSTVVRKVLIIRQFTTLIPPISRGIKTINSQ